MERNPINQRSMRVRHAAGVNLRKHLCFYEPFSICMMIETVAHLVPTNATRAFGVDLWVEWSETHSCQFRDIFLVGVNQCQKRMLR